LEPPGRAIRTERPVASTPAGIARLLAVPDRIALFLDYDGTLVPFQDDPARAVPGPGLLRLLDRLAVPGRREVAIVSGRSAGDLRRLLPGRCHLLALHGAQYVDPVGRTLDRVDLDACRAAVRAVAEACVRLVASIPGVRMEDKGAALTLHTRGCDRRNERRAVRGFLGAFREAAPGGVLSVLRGERTIELKPARADKGSAVLWLAERVARTCFPVYLGDDRSDEDAFRALQDIGATIRVGPPRRTSLARHRLADPRAVRELLELIASTAGRVG